MMKLKPGDTIAIGESLVLIRKTRQHQVVLGIRALKTTLIRKLP